MKSKFQFQPICNVQIYCKITDRLLAAYIVIEILKQLKPSLVKKQSTILLKIKNKTGQSLNEIALKIMF